MTHRRFRSAWLAIAVGPTAVACIDPTIETVVDTLGGEAPGVPPGPEHRPGQPCVTCHHGTGPGDPEFSLAGTVYQDQADASPLGGALVEFVDSADRTHSVRTNCAGNFYVQADDWQPRFPVWVQVVFGDDAVVMETPIHRDGACASCHADPPASDSVGHVFLLEEPRSGLPGGCR